MAAIQQVVPVSISLVGNGVAKTFKFTLGDTLAINTAGTELIINAKKVPQRIEGGIVEMPDNAVQCTITPSHGNSPAVYVTNFSEPLPDGVPCTLNMKFYFDSIPG